MTLHYVGISSQDTQMVGWIVQLDFTNTTYQTLLGRY